jgi:uncharacterized membrane protein YhdT
MRSMSRRALYEFAILFVIGTLICAYCSYMIHAAVERSQWFPGVGFAIISLIVGFVLIVAVVRRR